MIKAPVLLVNVLKYILSKLFQYVFWDRKIVYEAPVKFVGVLKYILLPLFTMDQLDHANNLQFACEVRPLHCVR